MNYRDMLLQDYFDESYDDYYDDYYDEDIIYTDKGDLADVAEMNRQLQELKNKVYADAKKRYGKDYDSKKVTFDTNEKYKKLEKNIKDTKSAKAIYNKYLAQWGGKPGKGSKTARQLFNNSKNVEYTYLGSDEVARIENKIGNGKTEYYTLDNMFNFNKDKFTRKKESLGYDEFKNSDEYKALVKKVSKEHPELSTTARTNKKGKTTGESGVDAFIRNSGAYDRWKETKISDAKATKAFNKSQTAPKATEMSSSKLLGAKDASVGVPPVPEKVSKFKQAQNWANGHKRQLAIGGAAAASAAGAGVTASGVKNIADLKNIAKAKAAWKASGSNLPFEKWRKQQLTKAGIKTGIGGALTALGAGGAVYAAKTKKLNEAEDLMDQYELVELEEAYLEGYYGQLIAEECGFDSEAEMIYFDELYEDDYDDYDDYYDEDYMLPYFG